MKKILLMAFMLISFNAAFSQFIIKGNQIVGSGSTQSYSLYLNGALYTASTVTWSVSGGTASISGSTTANPVTLLSGNPGNYTLTANVASTCCSNCSIPIQLPITVTGNGGVDTLLRITGPNNICTNTAGNNYNIQYISGATYYWSIYPSANTFIGNNGSYGIYLNVFAPGSYSLSCLVITSSGQTFVQEVNVYVTIPDPIKGCAGDGGEESNFVVSPNPGNNEISINTISNTNASATTVDSRFTYKIYNKLGKVVKSGDFSSLSKAVINTTDLPVDNYFVHIFNGKKIIQKQIIIKH